LRAARLVRRCTHDSALCRDLLAILRNDAEPQELRATAALAVGWAADWHDLDGFPEEDRAVPRAFTRALYCEIVGALERLVHDCATPTLVRRRCLEGLSLLERPWAEPTIEERPWLVWTIKAALSSEDSGWRASGLVAAGYVGGFDDEIVEALESSDREIAMAALGAAGVRQLEEAGPALLRASKSDDPELHHVVLDALLTLEVPGFRAMLARLRFSRDKSVSWHADEVRRSVLGPWIIDDGPEGNTGKREQGD
jgi:hypothetical protein